MAAMQWRRKHERISCFIPILLRFLGNSSQDGWGIILDISLGGLKIETRTPINDGQAVFISFSIADDFNFVNAKCTSRRTVQNGIYYTCGIRFVNSIDKNHLLSALQMHILSSDIESEE